MYFIESAPDVINLNDTLTGFTVSGSNYTIYFSRIMGSVDTRTLDFSRDFTLFVFDSEGGKCEFLNAKSTEVMEFIKKITGKGGCIGDNILFLCLNNYSCDKCKQRKTGSDRKGIGFIPDEVFNNQIFIQLWNYGYAPDGGFNLLGKKYKRFMSPILLAVIGILQGSHKNVGAGLKSRLDARGTMRERIIYLFRNFGVKVIEKVNIDNAKDYLENIFVSWVEDISDQVKKTQYKNLRMKRRAKNSA